MKLSLVASFRARALIIDPKYLDSLIFSIAARVLHYREAVRR